MSYEFHMVDMGGIDLVRVNETVVEGLHDRLEYGVDSCGNVILYNWFFADVAIAPSPYSTIEVADSIVINGVIRVTSDDRVSIIGIDPPQPSLIGIEINDNGIYNAVDYDADGFSTVTVDVEYGEIVQPELPEEYKKLEYLISDTPTTSASESLALNVGDVLVFKVRCPGPNDPVGPVAGHYSWNINVSAGSITPYGGYVQDKNDWSQEDSIYTLNSRIRFTTSYSGNFWYGAWRGGDYPITANSRLYPLYVLEADKSSVYSAKMILKAALIPCYRISDGTNSFYDAISNTFLNVVGSFSRGPEV